MPPIKKQGECFRIDTTEIYWLIASLIRIFVWVASFVSFFVRVSLIQLLTVTSRESLFNLDPIYKDAQVSQPRKT